MKKLTTLLMTLVLMSTALWADETVTVSANSSDISEGLDLKVVAKLFAEAKNLEEFETMLNNPDSAFCNLDLNGDGQVDYLRVVETGEGNKRLIVLQAILAKDIFQDVAVEFLLGPYQRLYPPLESKRQKRIPLCHIVIEILDAV